MNLTARASQCLFVFLLVALLLVPCSSFGLLSSTRTRIVTMTSSSSSSSSSSSIVKRVLTSCVLTSSLFLSQPLVVRAEKEEMPSLERCFNAVRKELDAKQGESLLRIQKDIDTGDWTDLKLFTREYDAGFRGGVLKLAWKQLGESKKRGIEISNSFTFDLIALNKAARAEDKQDALARAAAVKQDLVDFLTLEGKQ